MKITKEEFQRIGEESPLELFHQGIKAHESREKNNFTSKITIFELYS